MRRRLFRAVFVSEADVACFQCFLVFPARFGNAGVARIENVALKAAPQDAVVENRIHTIRFGEVQAFGDIGPVFARACRLGNDQVGRLRGKDGGILIGRG